MQILTGNIPVRVVLTNEDIKSIEQNDHDEETQRDPGCVWLESTLEDKGVSIDPLSCQRAVKFDVGDTNGAPGEKRGNGSQILKPRESCRSTTGTN